MVGLADHDCWRAKLLPDHDVRGDAGESFFSVDSGKLRGLCVKNSC
jgi:hypothetical protein